MNYNKNVEKHEETLNDIIQEFTKMQKKIVDYLKKNWKELDCTSKQMQIIKHLLTGGNWLKTKTQICKEVGCSRPTLMTCQEILKEYYSDHFKEDDEKCQF